jgi:ABC-2 type transport system permease protein
MAELVLSSSVFAFIQSFLRSGAVLMIGVFAFGFWHHPNPVTALLVFVPGCLVFSALGIISASFVLAFKQGDPIPVIYAGINGILGGAIFPLSVLPAWLQSFAVLLPLSHALAGMRLALNGTSPGEALRPIVVLAGLAVLLLPLAFASFQLALRRAKKEGSLVQY